MRHRKPDEHTSSHRHLQPRSHALVDGGGELKLVILQRRPTGTEFVWMLYASAASTDKRVPGLGDLWESTHWSEGYSVLVCFWAGSVAAVRGNMRVAAP
ncbi:hypothetical protein HJFPF1_01562 [Paramyrothecium foliicola]|nr:hypothetical protein HJFPF1_01562 [Paramyrothecium foliicola]